MKNMYPIVWSKLSLHKPNGTNNYFQDGQGKKIYNCWPFQAAQPRCDWLHLLDPHNLFVNIDFWWFVVIPSPFQNIPPEGFHPTGSFSHDWASSRTGERYVQVLNSSTASVWVADSEDSINGHGQLCPIYALIPFHPISSFIEFWFCLVLHLQLLWLTRVSNNRGIIAFPALCASAERWYSLCVSGHVLSIRIFNWIHIRHH